MPNRVTQEHASTKETEVLVAVNLASTALVRTSMCATWTHGCMARTGRCTHIDRCFASALHVECIGLLGLLGPSQPPISDRSHR